MKSKKLIAESLGYLTTAFGLVAALAWNEAVKKLIDEFIPKDGQGVVSLFVYAAIVTLVAVFITQKLVSYKEQFEKEEQDKA